MSTRTCIGLFAAAAMAGCGAPVVNQADLRTVTDGRTIVFDKEFRYDISKENDLPRPLPGQFRGLLKGTYSARYEDATGTYFANDNACVIYGTDLNRKLKFVSTGGVWIAKSPAEPAFRLYWISGKPGPIPAPLESEPPCGEVAMPSAVGPTSAALDPVVTDQIVSRTAPQATPAAAGAGVGLAGGMITAIAEYERGKIVLLPPPAGGTSIAGAFRAVQR